MRNRIVGYLIIGISILIGLIIFAFNRALSQIVATSCSHGDSCPMWGSIDFHTNISIGVMTLILLIGFYLVIWGDEKAKDDKKSENGQNSQIAPTPITKERYENVLAQLSGDEKKVLESIIEANGTIFQSDLVEKSGFTKVKVTRILDRLEGQGLIERKRRGMTNVVILKS